MNQNDVYLSISCAWNDLELALKALDRMELNNDGEVLKKNIKEAMDYYENLFLERKDILK